MTQMAFVDTIRQLWSHKLLVALAALIAVLAAILSAYRISVSPPGLEARSLTVSAASGQILVDSAEGSALVQGTELNTFEALSTRAKVYAQYLASLEARERIARIAGVPPRSLATSGPFSPETGQFEYTNQSSEERAGELLQEGAGNRLVFATQNEVPIITVTSQAADTEQALALVSASYATLQSYIRGLTAEGKPVRDGVTVRQLGAPQGGTLGGSNDAFLMLLAFLVVFGLGCAAILLVPSFVKRWRDLSAGERVEPGTAEETEDADLAAGLMVPPYDGAVAEDAARSRRRGGQLQPTNGVANKPTAAPGATTPS